VNRFERTREDHRSESAEDYVELVLTLIEEEGAARGRQVAQRLGVSQATVTKTIRRLAKEGYVVAEPYRSVQLTPLGLETAQAARQRHRLIVRFLAAIGVPDETAEADAEGIEHHVSEATLGAMRRFLDAR
jgi:DtxR family transcriptional regulator, manganese transport regulator